MTFQALWDQLRNKRPALDRSDSTLEFKPENLKKLLRQVYDVGHQSGKAVGQPITTKEPSSNPYDDLMGGIFKGRT